MRALIALLIVSVIVTRCRRLVCAPLREVPPRDGARLQFRMTDIYILTAQLAITARIILPYKGTIYNGISGYELAGYWTFLLFTWFAAVWELSKLPPTPPFRRALWLALGAPAANAVAFAFPISLVAFLMQPNNASVTAAAVALIVLIGVVVRALARWVADGTLESEIPH